VRGQARACAKRRSYFQHRELTSAEPHYFVVVNTDPIGDQLLLMAVASSKLESVRRRRRNLPPETLVEISHDYDEFPKQSIVDCNKVFRKSVAELVEDWRWGVVKPKKDLPKELLILIQAGVRMSPLVEAETKALIR
jgi:hypothetical protein